MNFERTNTKISLLEDYYSHFDEDHRLQTRHGKVEFVTNIKYILKYLSEDTSKKIIDVGAGTGAYSVYLDSLGYDVTAVELVEHNLDILKSKKSNVKAYLGNAVDLSMFSDKTFDYCILFGPLYHLLKEEDKLKALNEAKRIIKDDGIIFISYYMNEYAIITYGFIKKHILESKDENRIDETYHMKNLDDDLYSMVRLDDINKYNEVVGLERLQIIASDGAADYLRVVLNSLSDEEYEEFINYHLATCERSELLGSSAHLLDIVKKK